MLVLVLALLASGAPPAGAAAGFGDVEDGRWFTEAIAWMVNEQITTGTEPGCFSPTANVTRGQIVTFLFRIDSARGNNPTSAGHPFVDVTASYQQEPVGWAFSQGITTGTSNTTFDPNAPITRGDFGVMLWRYAGRPAGSAPHPFNDVTRSYQEEPISWMYANGVTTGTSPTTFNPWGLMTRAQAATFLHRFMDAPAVTTASLSAGGNCTRELRAALVVAGLTEIEASCAAPLMIEIAPETIIAIAAGSERASGTMISSISAVLTAGCIPIARWSALTRIFL